MSTGSGLFPAVISSVGSFASFCVIFGTLPRLMSSSISQREGYMWTAQTKSPMIGAV